MAKTSKGEAIREVPFNEWAVPPIGSAGIAWDDIDYLPQEVSEAAKADSKRLRQQELASQRRRRYRKFEFRLPLNSLVIVSWVLMAMAWTSTGPAFYLMPIFAGVSLVLSLIGMVVIKKSVFSRGIKEAVVCSVLCVAAICLYVYHMMDLQVYFF